MRDRVFVRACARSKLLGDEGRRDCADQEAAGELECNFVLLVAMAENTLKGCTHGRFHG